MANAAVMSMQFDLAPFERDLKRLEDPDLALKIAHDAVKKGLKPMVGMAKRLVRRQSGLLAQSITAVVRKYKSSGVVVGLVGPDVTTEGEYKGRRRVPRFYAHLVEFGAREHAIGQGSKLERRTRRRGQAAVIGPGQQTGRKHPGARRNPFLRPAFDATKTQVKNLFASEIATAIKREFGSA